MILVLFFIFFCAVIFFFKRFLFRKPTDDRSIEAVMNAFKKIDVGYHQILSVAYDLENNSKKNSSQANNVTRYVVDMKNSLKTSVEILKNFLEEQRKTSEILAKLKMEVETTRESNNKVIHEVETHLSEINKDIERVIHENLKYTNMLSNGFKEFKEAFSDIFHLLERINSVSEKINLLSLNASVESAKLESFLKGKHKMGFHVIADEIRKLSDSTKFIVKDMKNILKLSESKFEGLLEMSKTNEKLANTMKDIGNSTVKKFREIFTVMENNKKNTEKIFDSIVSRFSTIEKLLSDMITEIEKRFRSFEDDVFKIVKSTDAQREVALRLHRLSERLVEVCEEFRKIRDDLFEQVNEWVSIEDINSIEINTFLPELKKLGEMLSKNWNEKSFHRKLLDDFLKTHDLCEAIWTNEIDGSFIYSNPPEGIENAKVRKWFIKAIKGEDFVSEPYISAITKNYCVTISMPVMDKEGKILGVLGCDVGFSKRTEK